MRICRSKFVSELVKHDLTLAKLSEMSGLSRATLTAIKSGKSCKEETAKKIAEALGVPLKKLV